MEVQKVSENGGYWGSGELAVHMATTQLILLILLPKPHWKLFIHQLL